MTPAAFRELRERLSMTQVQLAEALGLTRRAIWAYESGRNAIPRQTELAMQALIQGRDIADRYPNTLAALAAAQSKEK